MARLPNMPNAENCTQAELDTAISAAVSKRSHVRLMAIKAFLIGFIHDQVVALYRVSQRTLSRWVNQFNHFGIDCLIEGSRIGRPRKITPEQRAQYEDLFEHPERVNRNHWTAKKFHGYLTKELEQETGYRTVAWWLREQDFRLEVPRPWPDDQDEEKRKAHVHKTNTYPSDSEIDLWYLDETGTSFVPVDHAVLNSRKQKNRLQGTTKVIDRRTCGTL